jgi:hypothetical protein
MARLGAKRRSLAGAACSSLVVYFAEISGFARSRPNQLQDLLPLVDAVVRALETIQPGETVTVP